MEMITRVGNSPLVGEAFEKRQSSNETGERYEGFLMKNLSFDVL